MSLHIEKIGLGAILLAAFFLSSGCTQRVAFNENSQIPTTPSINPSCEEQYQGIEDSLDSSNYCTADSDCAVIMLGGEYVKFGCYHFINKSVDKQQIYEKMNIYNKTCSDIIDKCAPAPEASCISNKCVHVDT